MSKPTLLDAAPSLMQGVGVVVHKKEISAYLHIWKYLHKSLCASTGPKINLLSWPKSGISEYLGQSVRLGCFFNLFLHKRWRKKKPLNLTKLGCIPDLNVSILFFEMGLPLSNTTFLSCPVWTVGSIMYISKHTTCTPKHIFQHMAFMFAHVFIHIKLWRKITCVWLGGWGRIKQGFTARVPGWGGSTGV